jgi:FkbM family methyltransferase
MISYSQNFEDVILWRALKDIKSGFYIDIGAQDPIIDSVSRAFYEAGWRGVHVEPSPRYAAKLRQDRPGETVLEWAVGRDAKQIQFFHFPDTGLSTGVAEIAKGHDAAGFRMEEITVEVKTTANLLDRYADRDIHWMKIDCEGMEPEIIEGWRTSSVRPWIVLVESILPTTQISSHDQWEGALLELGYDYVYTDELNRFYVSKAQPQLKRFFGPGPNLFDQFASTHFNLAFRNIEGEIAAQRGVLAKVRSEIMAETANIDALTRTRQATLNTVESQTAESLRLLKALKSKKDDTAKLYEARLSDLTAMVQSERDRASAANRWRELLEIHAAGAAAETSEFRRQLAQAQAELAHWRSSAAAAQAISQSMVDSTSWRISAPIRSLKIITQRLLGLIAGRAEPSAVAASEPDGGGASGRAPELTAAPVGLRVLFEQRLESEPSPILARAIVMFDNLKTMAAVEPVLQSKAR